MQTQQSVERDAITTGYVTDKAGRKWRVCKPGDSRVIEGPSNDKQKETRDVCPSKDCSAAIAGKQKRS